MSRCRIGITSPLAGREAPSEDMEIARHCTALKRAGAEPLILRKDMDALHIVDELGLHGVVFSGGGDVSAARYGGDETLANDCVDLERDTFEFALMQHVFERTLPVLAVCRGMQVANVLLGGTLIEDIHQHLRADCLSHHQVRDLGLAPTAYSHEISVVSGAALHEFVGTERVLTNSFHHQAIGKVAPALYVTARADDGVIEAVEFASGYASASGCHEFFIGVQWHPESLPEDRLSRVLYTRFSDACRAP